jgi:hypothetical protein
MKLRLFWLLLLLLAAMPAARAGLIYSGVQNIPIPVNDEGAYLRLDPDAIAGAFPADWETAPWINPFFGGVAIGNSPLLRPIITGTDQILNLAPGTVIDGTGNYVAGESGSSTHVGPGAGQFQIGVPGLIGFVFETTVGGPDYYGWLGIEIDNLGAGRIIDWGYSDTPGAGLTAGIAAVPEPATALFGLAVLTIVGSRRRRRVER